MAVVSLLRWTRSVRWGGVLEHPAYSDAWRVFGLPKPTRGGWSKSILDGGWVTEVSQRQYGHRARKRTWLYAVGAELPDLDWGELPPLAVVSGSHNHCDKPIGERNRVWSREAKATPIAFRDLLLSIAASAGAARAA